MSHERCSPLSCPERGSTTESLLGPGYRQELGLFLRVRLVAAMVLLLALMAAWMCSARPGWQAPESSGEVSSRVEELQLQSEGDR